MRNIELKRKKDNDFKFLQKIITERRTTLKTKV